MLNLAKVLPLLLASSVLAVALPRTENIMPVDARALEANIDITLRTPAFEVVSPDIAGEDQPTPDTVVGERDVDPLWDGVGFAQPPPLVDTNTKGIEDDVSEIAAWIKRGDIGSDVWVRSVNVKVKGGANFYESQRRRDHKAEEEIVTVGTEAFEKRGDVEVEAWLKRGESEVKADNQSWVKGAGQEIDKVGTKAFEKKRGDVAIEAWLKGGDALAEPQSQSWGKRTGQEVDKIVIEAFEKRVDEVKYEYESGDARNVGTDAWMRDITEQGEIGDIFHPYIQASQSLLRNETVLIIK